MIYLILSLLLLQSGHQHRDTPYQAVIIVLVGCKVAIHLPFLSYCSHFILSISISIFLVRDNPSKESAAWKCMIPVPPGCAVAECLTQGELKTHARLTLTIAPAWPRGLG